MGRVYQPVGVAITLENACTQALGMFYLLVENQADAEINASLPRVVFSTDMLWYDSGTGRALHELQDGAEL